MPKVSVVIPCYNHGELLKETLDSLTVQTFSDFEVIIVNDGSTDTATVDVLQSLNSPQIKVIHTVNKGVSAARNRGISEAVGEYILPLDADDKIGSAYIEMAVNVLENSPEVTAVYFDRILFGDIEGLAPLPVYDPVALLTENCIYAALFRKADWQSVGGFSEKMVYGWEDWDFWISLSALGKQFVKISEPLFFYRIRSNSRDHSLQLRQKIAMMCLIVLRHKYLYLRNINSLVLSVLTIFSRKMNRTETSSVGKS